MVRQPTSLSARRAWIEIGVLDFAPGEVFVALRKESVDRNQKKSIAHKVFDGRSPQGERG